MTADRLRVGVIGDALRMLDATLAGYQAAATREAAALPLARSAPVFAEGVMGLRGLVAGSPPAVDDGVSAGAGPGA